MSHPYYSVKSKPVAAVLAGVLGIFGAHRFYIRRTGSAIVQLIFCGCPYVLGIILLVCSDYYLEEEDYMGFVISETSILMLAGGFSIWVLVDFIRILTGGLRPGDGLIYSNEVGRRQMPAQRFSSSYGVNAPSYQNNYGGGRPYSAPYGSSQPASSGYAASQPYSTANDYAAKPAAARSTADDITKLERLAKLRDGEYISEEEFRQKKQEIINRM